MTDERVVYRTLVLRIELNGVSPPIWRRIQLTTEFLLCDIHKLFQRIFGWSDSSNYAFIIQGQKQLQWFGTSGGILVNKSLHEVLTLLPSDLREFEYHYGHYSYAHGFAWRCRVYLEPARYENNLTPVCLDGARAAPPEDVGDIAGYLAYLQLLNTHEEIDKDRLDSWLWGYFDPESFDRNHINDMILNEAY